MPRFRSPRPEVVALLRACKELPDEELHRLVLADWLEENADDPAEIALRDLIRLQVECDRLAGHDDRRMPLFSQAAALLDKHGAAWVGTLDTDRVNWGLQHGLFVMTCHEEDLSAGLLGRPGLPEGWGWVERLTVLCTSASDLGAMAQAEPLAHIGTLNLTRNPLRKRGAQALADSPVLINLCGLVLSRTELGHAGLGAVVASKHLHSLTRLELDGNGLGPKSMADLGSWPFLGRLYRLTVSDNAIGDAGLRGLLESDNLARLRELHLAGCQLGGEGVAALATAEMKVRELGLSRNGLMDHAALKELLGAKWIGGIETLKLSFTRIGDEGVRLLAGCGDLAALRQLELAGVEADRDTLRELIFAPGLAGLTRLDLRQTRIGYDNYRHAQQLRRPGLAILY